MLQRDCSPFGTPRDSSSNYHSVLNFQARNFGRGVFLSLRRLAGCSCMMNVAYNPSVSLLIPEIPIPGFNCSVIYFREMAFGGKPVKINNGSFNNGPVRLLYADFFPVDLGDRAPDDAAVDEIDNIFRRFLGIYFLWVKISAGARCSAYENRKNGEDCFEFHRAVSF